MSKEHRIKSVAVVGAGAGGMYNCHLEDSYICIPVSDINSYI